jgi:hypothetical protein
MGPSHSRRLLSFRNLHHFEAVCEDWDTTIPLPSTLETAEQHRVRSPAPPSAGLSDKGGRDIDPRAAGLRSFPGGKTIPFPARQEKSA